ncbi:pyruvate kinase [Elysia marginata]|uniref:Pyruvate kinase n=1 Tax=Elysia marginata TaxID=1093978 RepID=A0AAV4FVN0_9GAST|nr:pyruvate kinase [Elysia marginata]
MTTIRLNFSHGDHNEQGARIKTAREISKEKNLPISVMLDTKGPEVRVGKFKDGAQKVSAGEEIIIYSDKDSYQNKECGEGELTVSYDMSKDLEVDKPILVDDGKLTLTVKEINPGIIKTVAKNSHLVKGNKRINLPGTKFSLAFLAEKDINDIRFGCDMGIDYIAASFVNTPEDIKEIREILKEKGKEYIQIFAKIESQYAVDNFDKILKETDGVMVARGDLGLEIPYYEVPVAQKMMIRKCRAAGKPVIVATQMLDSMEKIPTPTRAEVTDVYFATELGADATMLSGESAAGQFPVQAVKVMSKINQRAEKEFYNKLFYPVQLAEVSKNSSGPRADIANAVAKKSQDGEYRFAVVLSRTGALLKEVAKFRPNAAIIGVTNKKEVTTAHGLTSSVFMHPEIDEFDKIKSDINESKAIAQKFGGKAGDKYLVVENEKIAEFVL